MIEQLYTLAQLSKMYSIKRDKVTLIMKGVKPDGTIARWAGYSAKTFEQAKKDWYAANYDEETDTPATGYFDEDKPDNDPHNLAGEISAQDLRIKTARAEALEIDNAERKNTLVARKNVEDFVRFMMNLYSKKIRELTKADHKDDVYNMIQEECLKEIEGYIMEHGVEHVITSETQTGLEEIAKLQVNIIDPDTEVII